MAVARMLVCLGLIALATGCGSSSATKATKNTTSVPWPDTDPTVEFGFIRSFTPLGQGYKLRLDLHLRFGPDKTGLAACIDTHECRPGTTGFLDDNYDHDLRFVVTYFVPPTASVGLVSFSGEPSPTVTARYFYALAHGRNPRRVQVMASGADAIKEFGFFVELAPKTSLPKGYELVTRMYQQYHP
jgi:hypothetical protein